MKLSGSMRFVLMVPVLAIAVVILLWVFLALAVSGVSLEDLVTRGQPRLIVEVCQEQVCSCPVGVFVRVIDLSSRVAVFGCAVEEERT